MRKHITTTESAVTRKRANRKLTVGIDLGDRSSRYCILDEQGEVLAEGSVATTKKGSDGVRRNCRVVRCRSRFPKGLDLPHTTCSTRHFK